MDYEDRTVCATEVADNPLDYSAWINGYEGASVTSVAWHRIQMAAYSDPERYNDVPGVPRGGPIGVMVRHKPSGKVLRVTRP